MKSENQIFLSYHERDLRFVLKLATDLKNLGIPVYVDCLELPASKAGNDNHRRIIASPLMIAAVSTNYLQSEDSRRDIETAIQHRIPVLYIALNLAGDFSASLPFLDRAEYTIPFTSRNYSKHLSELISVLRAIPYLALNISPTPRHIHYINTLTSRILHHVLNDPFNVLKGVAGFNLLSANFRLKEADFAIVDSHDSGYLSKLDIFSAFQRIHISDIANRCPRLIIAGEPGSGKTAILHYLLLDAIRKYQASPHFEAFPFYLNLMEWSENTSLSDFVRMNWPFADDPFLAFAHGNATVFVDNLDGMLESNVQRQSILSDWLNGNTAPNRIVTTCRLTGDRLPDYILPYHLPVAFQVNAPEPQTLTSGAVGETIERLWLESGQTVTRQECEQGLTRLASVMTSASQTFIRCRTALKYISNRSLKVALSAYLVEIHGDYMRFSNILFQNYFAALSLDLQLLLDKVNTPISNSDTARARQNWDKPIKLFVTLTDNVDRAITTIARKDPFLALDCIASGAKVRSETYDTVLNLAVEFMRSSGDFRLALAMVLAKLDSISAKNILAAIIRDSDDGDQQQSAIKVFRDIDPQDYQNALRTIRELANQEQAPTLPERISHRITPILVDLLTASDRNTRRIAAILSGQNHDKSTTRALERSFSDVSCEVAEAAISAAGSIKSPTVVSRLIQLAHTPPLRSGKRLQRRATEILARRGKAGVQNLLRLLDSQLDNEIRLSAIKSLRSVRLPRVQDALLQLTHDRDTAVRMAAIESLDILEPSAKRRIIEVLRDTEKAPHNQTRICDRAARLLENSENHEMNSIAISWRAKAQQQSTRVSEYGGNKNDREFSKTSSRLVKSRLIASKSNSRVQTVTPKHKSSDSASVLVESDEHSDKGQSNKTTRRDNSRTIESLLNSLRDTDRSVVVASIATLKQILPRLTGDIITLMENPEVNLRAAAIDIAGHFRHEAAVPALIECLGDTRSGWLSDKRICDMAAEVLEQINTPEALIALSQWRDRDLPFGDLLQDLRSDQWDVRQNALKSLQEYARGWRGTPNAPLLAHQLSLLLRDSDWVIRWASTEALGWVGNSTSVPSLVSLTNDPNWKVRISVIRALTEIGDPEAIDAIIGTLRDANRYVREAAAESLGLFQSAITISVLTEALGDSEPFVRLAAVESLGKIGGTAVAQPLLKALEDEDSNVRWAAAQGLSNIEGLNVTPKLAQSLDDVEGPYWEQKRISDVISATLERANHSDVNATLEQVS